MIEARRSPPIELAAIGRRVRRADGARYATVWRDARGDSLRLEFSEHRNLEISYRVDSIWYLRERRAPAPRETATSDQ